MTSQQREYYEQAKKSGELRHAITQLVDNNLTGVYRTLLGTSWVDERQANLITYYLDEALETLPIEE